MRDDGRGYGGGYPGMGPGQNPYGYYAGGYEEYVKARKVGAKAVAAFVLAALGAFVCVLPFASIPVSLASIALGYAARRAKPSALSKAAICLGYSSVIMGLMTVYLMVDTILT